MDDWRYERKIVLKEKEAHAFDSWLVSHPMAFRQAFPEREIGNVYFDTENLYHFYAHIYNAESRVKWRLRTYDRSQSWKLEEKIKFRYHGTKRMYDPRDALDAMVNRRAMKIENQCLSPVLANCYRRRYYHSPSFGIRVTVDSNIMYSGPDRKLWIPEPDYFLIMEIKYPVIMVEAGANFLDTLPWGVENFSKYVRGLNLLNVAR